MVARRWRKDRIARVWCREAQVKLKLVFSEEQVGRRGRPPMPLDQSLLRMSYSRADNIIKHNHDEIRPRGWLSRGLRTAGGFRKMAEVVRAPDDRTNDPDSQFRIGRYVISIRRVWRKREIDRVIATMHTQRQTMTSSRYCWVPSSSCCVKNDRGRQRRIKTIEGSSILNTACGIFFY